MQKRTSGTRRHGRPHRGGRGHGDRGPRRRRTATSRTRPTRRAGAGLRGAAEQAAMDAAAAQAVANARPPPPPPAGAAPAAPDMMAQLTQLGHAALAGHPVGRGVRGREGQAARLNQSRRGPQPVDRPGPFVVRCGVSGCPALSRIMRMPNPAVADAPEHADVPARAASRERDVAEHREHGDAGPQRDPDRGESSGRPASPPAAGCSTG